MKTYAVSWVSFFDNDLKIQPVAAIGPVQAIAAAMAYWSDDDATDEWLDDLTDGSRTVEEIREEFFNVDQLIAVCLV